MFKVLVGKAEVGGSLAFQKDLVNRAKADLEGQLNSSGVEQVCAVGVYESDHEVNLVAVVKTSDATPKKTSKKKGA